MPSWTETYRGTVAPWECDVTEHFTIACYLDRVEQTSAMLADILGLAENLITGVYPRLFNLRFIRELRAGDSFHVESAAVRLDPVLRLGHCFVNSTSGERVTWVEEVWDSPMGRLTAERRDIVGRLLSAWDGPPTETRPDPRTISGTIPTARGRVRPIDLDEFGRFGLAAFVHRFTDSSLQTSAAIGMTGDYMKTNRRGFSTFELALRISRAPRLGDPYLVETGIAHLASSSIRFLHLMSDPHTGDELARLSQFGVQLDLDARRPAPVPEEVRAGAARLLLPG